jgi:2-polyprenyl-3-methyl-5-hydroxy-6-metoxy-1,4-benzoquinol methylase
MAFDVLRKGGKVNTDYDAIYRDKPDKWTSGPRDEFAYWSIEGYLGHEPESLLDVGCGNGHTIGLLKMLWPDTRFVGVDVSEVACRLARAGAPGAVFVHGTVEDVVSHGPFEVVTLMGVAEHFEDVVDGLVRAAAMLNPGGIIYLEAPNNLLMSGRSDEGWYASSVQEEWHLYRGTWEEKFKQAGLKIGKSLIGRGVEWEFVWILERGLE